MIGTKEKEREVSICGRFFAMMTWYLRMYFVVTEHLVKIDFLDLFGGITMKDSLNEVQKKLLNASQGQSSTKYWCYANHIDYSKWNNHQRHKANEPLFT